MVFKVGEEKVEMPFNTRLNQYSAMVLFKGDTEEELLAKIVSHKGQIFTKAMYFSPTSKKHIAYVLINESLTKE